MLTLEKFTFGVGDRFAHQARAQLRAFQMLAADGVEVTPVWNKSNREHTFIGSQPQFVFDAAQEAVKALNWKGAWHVDADHIRIDTVDKFLPSSDFFTIDVADSIGKPPTTVQLRDFCERHKNLVGTLTIPGDRHSFSITQADIERIAAKYLLAIQEAGRIYRHIALEKNEANFIAEVSMDETEQPQTPPELLIILAALADEKVRLQTIAPKFTGRFNKGVDYVGNLDQFVQEFNADLAVIAEAIHRFNLPQNLKLSIHSGSDKFSLYPIIHGALVRTGAGIHVKTAGTTWLEEIIGLAEAGGDGLELAREIYANALRHLDELCAPYASVIDIDPANLPSAETVASWNGTRLANTLRHNPEHPDYIAGVRQLIHVSFKLAAKAGPRLTDLLKLNEEIVGKNVTENIYKRHLKPLFVS